MSAKIVAEIGADVSGFERGLKQVEHSSDHFAKKVGKKFEEAFGVGLLAAAFFEAPRQMIEAADKIAGGAAKLKVTTDEYQMLSAAAKDAGLEVGEFIKKNSENGQMLDRVIKNVEQYRTAIKMTGEEVKQWNEIGSSSKNFMGGMMAPIGFLARKGFSAGASLLNAGGAAVGALSSPFGLNFLGVPNEDYMLEARRNFGNFFGANYDRLAMDHESALPLSGHGEQNKLKKMERNLLMLARAEQRIRREADTKFDFVGPTLTSEQEGGAYVSRQSILVSETHQTNEKLEQIREEMQKTKEEIQKLRTGEGGA